MNSPAQSPSVSLQTATRRGLVGNVSRAVLGHLVRCLLRVSVTCPPEVQARLRDGGVLVTSNHVSLADGPLIALSSPVPLVFAVDTDYSRRSRVAMKGMAFLARIGCGAVVPLDSNAPFGIRALISALRAGGNVMVFPEGEIAATGALPPRLGLAWLERRARPARVEVAITGAERSRLFAKRGTEWLPRIHLDYRVND